MKMELPALYPHALASGPVRSRRAARVWYWLLAGTVVSLLLSQTWNQRWQADFWQHSACVRELSLHPLSPGHPELPVIAPHEFYNPYSLLLGLASRVSGLSSVAVLSIMGIVNFVLFAWALRRFCLKLSSHPWCPFFTLLFTLVLWGYRPWMFSGFFHLAMLGETAQYPSCFCAALTFLAWSVYVDFAGGRANPIQVLLLSFVAFVVLVSHPHTAVALHVGLFALWWGVPHQRRRLKTILLGAAVLAAVLAASAWPYYSFYDLLAKNGGLHYAGNRWMYVHVVRNTFAGLLFLPCIIGRLQKNWRDPIGLMFVALLGVYALGYVSGKYALGRTIVYIMFCLHFSAADWFAQIRTEEVSNRSGALWHHLVTGTAAVLVLI